ncbi:lamin tail domain-containing protein [Carboxylicivirga marina]|uniref:Lamin tail domain-containing protein n=1 Tax=Carboxylicivirga marina TaxID=2800988 RepID=A0ABS1HEG2_9BACT|nr:lamin tail domain-containing protein [Carboxylicivirga marina]MBK3516029.1 lamin tail domain-containing protein [Carboxylicivirga marina]
MKKLLLLPLCLLIVNHSNAQILINEIDPDQTGSDVAEFIELYNSSASSISLDGYELVLYNGSDNASYANYPLDIYSIEANGYFVIGNVAGADISLSSLQNGTDAIALYKDHPNSFTNDTPLTLDNLVDAVVYGNSPNEVLLTLLNADEVQLIDDTETSLQRDTDGAGGARNTSAFVSRTPTPGASNSTATNSYTPKTEKIKVIPNPFYNDIRIESSRKIKAIHLFNAACNQILKNNNSIDGYIETTGLKAGLYILQVDFFDGNTTTQKVIKK